MSTLPTVPVTGPTGPTAPTGPVAPTSPATPVERFKSVLRSIPIEAKISEEEAEQAIILFSVVNMLLAGKSQRRVGNEDKIDVLGVLTLYYGLQDRSLPGRLVLDTSGRAGGGGLGTGLWQEVEGDLQRLRDVLDQLGADVVFLEREGKRQFNLGTNNDVVGNVEFPELLKRYVDIANDSLLTMDIRERDTSDFGDKEKVGKAIDLLVELKGLILQLVRSLSKYGTIATSRANAAWAGYEADALEVLKKVAKRRLTDDVDEQNEYALLADLIGKNRDTEIAPHAVLAQFARVLLDLAMTTYKQVAATGTFERFDRDHLMDLFQKGGGAKTAHREDFLTTQMREQASVISRYPVRNWGV